MQQAAQYILNHLLQISKQEFVEGYHKLALLPPVSRAPISSAPVDDQTANGQHNTLSHCDDLGSPKTESIYHQISLTQNPFLRQVNTSALSCPSIGGVQWVSEGR